jgi:hypothetical protein
MSQIPKVFVFDLDGCVWEPEMYQHLPHSNCNHLELVHALVSPARLVTARCDSDLRALPFRVCLQIQDYLSHIRHQDDALPLAVGQVTSAGEFEWRSATGEFGSQLQLQPKPKAKKPKGLELYGV